MLKSSAAIGAMAMSLMSVGAAKGGEFPALVPGGAVLDRAPLSTVQGKVYFQKKTMVVPLDSVDTDEVFGPVSICQSGAPCPKPKPYWSMIVISGGTRYELSRPFGIGEIQRPEMVEVAGVAIRPGAQVAVEGVVETFSPTYGVISEVKNITVVMDRLSLAPESQVVSSIWSSEFSGWTCRDIATDPRHEVKARIWFGKKSPQDSESFHLQVVETKQIEPEVQNVGITQIENLEVISQSRRLVYHGAKKTTAAVIAIEQNPAQIYSFPSMLRRVQLQQMNGKSVPVEDRIQMDCKPTR